MLQSWQDYGINPDGTQWSVTYTGPDGINSPMWSKTTTDFLGRGIREERPGFPALSGVEGGGTVVTNESFYNAKNQLVRTQVSSFQFQVAPTLFSYNDLGEQFRSGQDIDGDHALSNTVDRISESHSSYWYGDPGLPSRSLGEGWWRVSTSLVYAQDGSATPTTNGVQKTRLTGLGSLNPELGTLNSESVSSDIRGNQTISQSFIDRASKKTTNVVFYPDSTNAAVSVLVNGLAVYSKSKTGLEYTQESDALGRRIGSTDPRTGTSVTHYNSLGQVDWVMDAASNKTWFAYDEATGRQIAVSNALGFVTHSHYSPKGELLATWGATYPVAYEFDDYGRMTAMATTREPTNDFAVLAAQLASGHSIASLAPTWSLDVTQWLYDEATGLLTNKLYADGKGTSYTYTPDGKLETRNWARGVSTTYSYTNTTGELIGIDYSDATPDVSFAFDRLGRQVTINDGQGTRTFAYDPATLALSSETIINQQSAITNVLTRSQDTLGRSSGFSLGSDYSVGYGFDDVGRFSQVSNFQFQVSYSYLPGSDLVSGWSMSAGGTQSLASVSRAFEAHRNVLTAVENRAGGAVVSRFDYTNDELARRTRRVDNASVTNDFGYNPRSELTAALMGTNEFGYAYDPIGNRQVATNNAEVLTYLANELNQYTNIADGVTLTPAYDLDGNMTGYGDWTFAWSGENRLILASNAAHRVEYAYDYQGRMFRKVVDGQTNSLIWDGFNIVGEVRPGVTNWNVWGLDLSGSLQGAGGIGALLCVVQNGQGYFPVADGNGNITEYTDADGTVVAHREYSPYGETLALTGDRQNEFTHWWSTKPWDPITGMSEYEFRKYLPGLGRWLSRDPIGEEGGVALYLHTGNSPATETDFRGMWLIQRNGDPLADAIAESGDSVRTLAPLVGLTEWEYRSWLSAEEMPDSIDEPLCGNFKVPNTIYAVYNGHYGAIGRWLSRYNNRTAEYQGSGYHVEMAIDGPTAVTMSNRLRSHWNDKTLQGFYYMGHGGEEVTRVDVVYRRHRPPGQRHTVRRRHYVRTYGDHRFIIGGSRWLYIPGVTTVYRPGLTYSESVLWDTDVESLLKKYGVAHLRLDACYTAEGFWQRLVSSNPKEIVLWHGLYIPGWDGSTGGGYLE